MTGERVNKPAIDNAQIKEADSDGSKYSYAFESQDVHLNVSVEDGPIKWEAPFLFYVIPIPTRYDSSPTKPLSVQLVVEPKSSDVLFDPWQFYLISSNDLRLPPEKVWQNEEFLGGKTSKALPITKSTTFSFEFYPWNQVNAEKNMTFQFSIEGIKVSEKTVFVAPITFKSTTEIRSGFKLPY